LRGVGAARRFMWMEVKESPSQARHWRRVNHYPIRVSEVMMYSLAGLFGVAF
jgi:hypothetical protein